MMSEQALIAVPPDQDVMLTSLRTAAFKIRDEAKALVVTTKDEAEFATAYLGEIATIKKKAEAHRVTLVQPHNDYTMAVNGTVKFILAPVLEADAHLRKLVLAYQVEEKRREAAEIARQKAEAEAVLRAAREETERLEREARAAHAAMEEAKRAGDLAAAAAAEAERKAKAAAWLRAEQAREDAAKERTLVAQQKPEGTVRAAGMGTATVKKRWTFRYTDQDLLPRMFLVPDEAMIRQAIAGGNERSRASRFTKRMCWRLAARAHKET